MYKCSFWGGGFIAVVSCWGWVGTCQSETSLGVSCVSVSYRIPQVGTDPFLLVACSALRKQCAFCILLLVWSFFHGRYLTVCEPSSLKAEKTLKKPSGVLLRHFVPDQQKTTLISNLNMSTLCDPLSKGLARCSPRFLWHPNGICAPPKLS